MINLKKGFAGLASIVLGVLFVQATAHANPLADIINVVTGVNKTIQSLDAAINGTRYTVNSLAQTLGINLGNNGSAISETEPTRKVLQLYEIWYKGMSPEEKETVSWLVMQHARNQTVTFETISMSEWFLQKPIEQQSKVGTTFFKLQNIIEATAKDKNRFLAFAFCINSGSGQCEK